MPWFEPRTASRCTHYAVPAQRSEEDRRSVITSKTVDALDIMVGIVINFTEQDKHDNR